ncbi:MAG: ABC transporter ATP-binding protein/permease [Clostridiales bacterium]|nr:ABC transporter ATP-binding protein/permease [Clostridiales bacterium]
MARLWQLAAYKKALVVTAGTLAVIAAVASFVPFLSVFMILREALGHIKNLADADGSVMITWGIVALGGVVANALLYFAALMCSHLAAFNTQYELKRKYMAHLTDMPLGFHTVTASGKVRKIVDDNIEKLEGFVAHTAPDLVASIAAPLIMLIALFAFDWRFGLVTLIPVILIFAIQSVAYGGEKSREMLRKYQGALEEMNSASVEYVRGISVIKAFNQTIFSFRKFRDIIRSHSAFTLKYTLSWKTVMPLFLTLVNNIYLFLIPVGILIGRYGADYNSFALSFLFYLILAPSFGGLFMKIMYVSQSGKQVADGIERMDKILAVKPLPAPASPKAPDGFTVEFDNVSFSYDQSVDTAEALKDVSFTADQGKITAVVGPSGSGKSTIAHLIPRFWDVTGGSIKIGGADIRDVENDALMKSIAFVFQDVFLFRESILDNIREGAPNASREQIIAAAKAAQCHGFIEKLPRGYDTVIGRDGIHLSGGERQRIVLARAVIKDAPVIVLDEATAFADPENERLIQLAFEKLIENKTVIIIAHRLSTVKNADKIVVMDGGRAVECGTHAGLVKKGGRYAAMWKGYNDTLEWKMLNKEVSANV